MMKWYFSKDGEISGPLGLEESNKFIAKNKDLYAWHPSYAQWMPVDCIEDFDTPISIPKPPQEVPQELFEEFIAEEREMINTMSRIESTLANTMTSLSELDIESYVNKTKSLNEEVKTTLRNIEQQFEALQKNIAGVQES